MMGLGDSRLHEREEAADAEAEHEQQAGNQNTGSVTFQIRSLLK